MRATIFARRCARRGRAASELVAAVAVEVAAEVECPEVVAAAVTPVAAEEAACPMGAGLEEVAAAASVSKAARTAKAAGADSCSIICVRRSP